VSNSVDNRPQEASDRGSAVRTSMLLVGVLVAGVSLLHLPTSLMSQANTQVEAGPPIVKASDKWIRLGGQHIEQSGADSTRSAAGDELVKKQRITDCARVPTRHSS
jgi:hypothetical protein